MDEPSGVPSRGNRVPPGGSPRRVRCPRSDSASCPGARRPETCRVPRPAAPPPPTAGSASRLAGPIQLGLAVHREEPRLDVGLHAAGKAAQESQPPAITVGNLPLPDQVSHFREFAGVNAPDGNEGDARTVANE